jgi:hypothetical protein
VGREMLCPVATFANMFGALSAEPPQGLILAKISEFVSETILCDCCRFEVNAFDLRSILCVF